MFLNCPFPASLGCLRNSRGCCQKTQTDTPLFHSFPKISLSIQKKLTIRSTRPLSMLLQLTCETHWLLLCLRRQCCVCCKPIGPPLTWPAALRYGPRMLCCFPVFDSDSSGIPVLYFTWREEEMLPSEPQVENIWGPP